MHNLAKLAAYTTRYQTMNIFEYVLSIYSLYNARVHNFTVYIMHTNRAAKLATDQACNNCSHVGQQQCPKAQPTEANQQHIFSTNAGVQHAWAIGLFETPNIWILNSTGPRGLVCMENLRLPRYRVENGKLKVDRIRRSSNASTVSDIGPAGVTAKMRTSSLTERPPTRNTWKPPSEVDRTPKVLDVIGCHREVTICGHVDLVRRLPLREADHIQLLDQYLQEPGNYEGRYSDYYDSAAKLLDYGNGYVAVRLYDDITRPEISEFLLSKGWKMIGFAANKEGNKTYIIEKWCNIRDH
ncbi:hypothetical protein CAPTEDRAFT_229141 [Capitella teleta]|uniref:Uncharacterized protein n=1 Tax=Capitella teleta TaxID=283909 RepID=R7VC73_CAPTE|nr:hypothetical protein CAPTEDRAFT_229141 [Capitella teleta]|eukprot:ELU13275.1 hypothetical protein CAPTEDRAFT_229141 [Capitella teleta]